MSIRHVVSVSGGKDSAATLLIAIERFGRDSVVPIFCDTGNEHEAVHAYLDYLEQALGIRIERLKADFSAEIAAKRLFIARDQRIGRRYDREPVIDAEGNPVPQRNSRGQIITRVVRRHGKEIEEPVQKTRKVGGGRKIRWTNKAKRRALSVLYPTGNPFLDLCLWKGRFPSRTAQFCTEELKRDVAVRYQLDLVDAGHTVISWQGVRRNESPNRRHAKLFERLGPRLYAYRPLVDWTAADVFAYCASYGVQPNPLYLQGMTRVGCMPCINCGKDELRQIAARAPGHVAQKSDWEKLVSMASKRGFSTFFNKDLHQKNTSDRSVMAANAIHEVIRWAHTTRGGQQYDLLVSAEDASACASSYGPCDSGDLA